MDALYFRVSTDRQTTENQFADLLQVAEKDGSGRDWSRIRQLLSSCILEEAIGDRVLYSVNPRIVAELADLCVYVEQGRSSRRGAKSRPLFEQMKQDAALRRFNRLLVWKVSRLGRDMREVISARFMSCQTWASQWFPSNLKRDRSTPPWGSCCGRSKHGSRKWRTRSGQRQSRPVKPEP